MRVDYYVDEGDLEKPSLARPLARWPCPAGKMPRPSRRSATPGIGVILASLPVKGTCGSRSHGCWGW